MTTFFIFLAVDLFCKDAQRNHRPTPHAPHTAVGEQRSRGIGMRAMGQMPSRIGQPQFLGDTIDVVASCGIMGRERSKLHGNESLWALGRSLPSAAHSYAPEGLDTTSAQDTHQAGKLCKGTWVSWEMEEALC